MNNAPTNHDGISNTSIANESFMEALASEFPGLTSEHLASAYETVRRGNNAPVSDEVFKTRMRLICQSRGLSHTL